MPELPEVETVKRGLNRLLKGDPKIDRIKLNRKDLRTPMTPALKSKFKGQPILRIQRRAKYLVFETPEWSILSHLGMSGSWRIKEPGDKRAHDHCSIFLEDGRELTYYDPRRFGILEAYKNDKVWSTKWLNHLGPEPLDKRQFTPEYLNDKCKNKKAPIKNLIMNQEVVVGVGNIYASEALFMTGIRPTRQADNLSLKECEQLVKNITLVLKRAIQSGGTTLKDFRQAGGSEGYFQQKLYVYGREDQLCLECQSEKIKNTRLAGRSTFWCSECQK